MLQLPNLYDFRVRWWDGTQFQDTGEPYYSTLKSSSVGVASTTTGTNYHQTLYPTDPSTGTVALPATPILGKLPGVLTLVFIDGTIVRYSTGTGAQLPTAGEQEPLIVELKQEPGGLRIVPSGDYGAISTLVFERSSDLKTWREIVDGVDGGLIEEGMGVIPKNPEFYRARYR